MIKMETRYVSTLKVMAISLVQKPYIWKVTLWNGFEWLTYNITTSDHNYDMGVFVENFWRLVVPFNFKNGE